MLQYIFFYDCWWAVYRIGCCDIIAIPITFAEALWLEMLL